MSTQRSRRSALRRSALLPSPFRPSFGALSRLASLAARTPRAAEASAALLAGRLPQDESLSLSDEMDIDVPDSAAALQLEAALEAPTCSLPAREPFVRLRSRSPEPGPSALPVAAPRRSSRRPAPAAPRAALLPSAAPLGRAEEVAAAALVGLAGKGKGKEPAVPVPAQEEPLFRGPLVEEEGSVGLEVGEPMEVVGEELEGGAVLAGAGRVRYPSEELYAQWQRNLERSDDEGEVEAPRVEARPEAELVVRSTTPVFVPAARPGVMYRDTPSPTRHTPPRDPPLPPPPERSVPSYRDMANWCNYFIAPVALIMYASRRLPNHWADPIEGSRADMHMRALLMRRLTEGCAIWPVWSCERCVELDIP